MPRTETPLTRIRRGAGVLAAILLMAVLGYRLMGRTWIDSVDQVVHTVATVGFTEESHMSDTHKLFIIAVIVFGISAAAYTFGGFIEMVAEGEIQRALGVERITREIEKLHGHVVVCGYGRMGQILASELKGRRTPLVIIDKDPGRIIEAQVQGYLTITGDATEEDVLGAAGIARARTLVTVLPNDALNVFITLTSRNLNHNLQIMARGEFPSTQKKLMQAGANRVVLPAAIGAQRIAAMVTRPSTIELLELFAGRAVMDVEVDEVQVTPESPLVGKAVAQTETRRKHGLLVVAVKRKEGQMVFNPDAEFVFQPGDIVIVMGRAEDMERFRQEYGL